MPDPDPQPSAEAAVVPASPPPTPTPAPMGKVELAIIVDRAKAPPDFSKDFSAEGLQRMAASMTQMFCAMAGGGTPEQLGIAVEVRVEQPGPPPAKKADRCATHGLPLSACRFCLMDLRPALAPTKAAPAAPVPDTPLGLGAPPSGDVGGEHGPSSRPGGSVPPSAPAVEAKADPMTGAPPDCPYLVVWSNLRTGEVVHHRLRAPDAVEACIRSRPGPLSEWVTTAALIDPDRPPWVVK